MTRTVICGGPNCGKTTLATRLAAGLGIEPRHTGGRHGLYRLQLRA